jgi:hypothetical protein
LLVIVYSPENSKAIIAVPSSEDTIGKLEVKSKAAKVQIKRQEFDLRSQASRLNLVSILRLYPTISTESPGERKIERERERERKRKRRNVTRTWTHASARITPAA